MKPQTILAALAVLLAATASAQSPANPETETPTP